MSKPQVVITRKHKKLRKGLHLAAFVLTGGASSVVTATKAATNASYNADTARLAAGPRRRRAKVTLTDEERAYMAAHVPKEYRH